MRHNWWAGYLHGGVWKIAALMSKAAFVFLIIPRLSDGVFGSYSLVSSTTMLVSIVLSFGSLDSLPTILRGRDDLLGQVALLFHGTIFGIAICLLIFALGGGFLALGASVVFVNLSYLVLAGILRASRPNTYEILANAPTLLFIILCLAVPSPSLVELLWIFVIANAAVTMGIAWNSGLLFRPDSRQVRYASAALVRLLKTGNGKSLSSVLIIADFRALILVPSMLLATLPADALAVALTVGEAFWQLGMVVVNRNYSRYCAGGGSIRSSLKAALLLLTIFVIAGAVIAAVPIPFSIKKFDWPLIGWATVFFGSLMALTELRTYFWSRNLYGRYIILVQILVVAVQFVVVVSFPTSSWLPVSALAMLVLTLAGIAWIARIDEPKAPRKNIGDLRLKQH